MIRWHQLDTATEWAERLFRTRGRPASKYDSELRDGCLITYGTHDLLVTATDDEWHQRFQCFAWQQVIRAGSRLPHW